MPTLDEVKEFLRKKQVDKHLTFIASPHHVPDDWATTSVIAEGHGYQKANIEYRHEGVEYRVTTSDWRRYATPDSSGMAGDIRLFVNGEEVLLMTMFDRSVNSQSLKSLKAGPWIDALPGLVEAVKAGEKERMARWKAEQDAKTMSSIDLGDLKI